MKPLILALAKWLQSLASEPERPARSLSLKSTELIEQYEGRKSHKYKDSGGAWTIGIGHLLTKSELTSGKIIINGEAVKYCHGLTAKQIDALFNQDMAVYARAVDSLVKVKLTDNQYGALVSFCYNIGISAFEKSTLLRLLNAGDYRAVPSQLQRWVYDGGKKVQGLANRREKEIEAWNA